MNRSGRRQWWLGALLVLLSTALTLGALEMTVRVFVDRYQCDARLGWTYRPNRRVLVFNWTGEFAHVVGFNRDGLRDDRDPPAGSDDRAFRIVVLGDSFSAGLQVPSADSFSRLLETRLEATAVTGRRIEVWNAAVDGFGTAQALRMFRGRVARYRPDVVFLGLFLANDLGDNVPDGGSRNHYLAQRCGRPYLSVDGSGALVDGSATAAPRRSWFTSFLPRSELYANLFPSVGAPATFADWDVFTGKHREAVDAAWKVTRVLMRELDREVRQGGGKLIVILMPHQREARVGIEHASAHIDFERAHALAEAFLHETEMAYIDLYPSLRNAVAKGEHPYLDRDMHWNGLGHRIVARAIEHWLVAHCRTLQLPIAKCAAASGAKASIRNGRGGETYAA